MYIIERGLGCKFDKNVWSCQGSTYFKMNYFTYLYLLVMSKLSNPTNSKLQLIIFDLMTV